MIWAMVEERYARGHTLPLAVFGQRWTLREDDVTNAGTKAMTSRSGAKKTASPPAVLAVKTRRRQCRPV